MGVRGLITHCPLLILIGRLGSGKQRLRERRTCGLSPGAGASRWFRSGFQQSWDPDKDSKVAIFQRDTFKDGNRHAGNVEIGQRDVMNYQQSSANTDCNLSGVLPT